MPPRLDKRPAGGSSCSGGVPMGGSASSGGVPAGGSASSGGMPAGGSASSGWVPAGGAASSGWVPAGGSASSGEAAPLPAGGGEAAALPAGAVPAGARRVKVPANMQCHPSAVQVQAMSCGHLSKRLRKMEEGFIYMEQQRMAQSARESAAVAEREKAEAEKTELKQQLAEEEAFSESLEKVMAERQEQFKQMLKLFEEQGVKQSSAPGSRSCSGGRAGWKEPRPFPSNSMGRAGRHGSTPPSSWRSGSRRSPMRA